MHRTGGKDELVASAEWNVFARLVHDITAVLEHVPNIVDVVPVQWEFAHTLRDIGGRPQIKRCDIRQYLGFRGVKVVYDSVGKDTFADSGLC